MPEPFVMAIEESELRSRVGELGAELAAAYRDRSPVLVGILSGSLFFLADLVRAMDIELEVDFMALSRFGEGGRVKIVMDTEVSLTKREVVIVEDIVDTGLSLSVLRRMLAARQPRSLVTVTLLDKVPRRLVAVPVEYRGFAVGDEYLVGYGLDWQGKFRQLRDVWAMDRAVLTQADGARLMAAGQ